MNYIVLDLEWNQSETRKSKVSKSLPFEIIEIGAVKLDQNFKIVDTFSETIRPVIYPKMHRIARELTGYTSRSLQHSARFSKVFKRFFHWCGTEEYRFCTWGPSDLTELQRNMKFYNIKLFPTPVLFYDIQEIFSFSVDTPDVRRSLEYAVNYFNIPTDDNFHRALSDAYYTTHVMRCLNKEQVIHNYSVDTYQQPKRPEDEIFLYYDRRSKYVSRTFSNRPLALQDAEVISTRCCICHKKLRRKIRWFSENSKNYYSLAFCPEHGYMSGKIHMKKNSREQFYVIKDLVMTDENGADDLYQKRKEYQKKQAKKRKGGTDVTQ